MQVNLRRLEKPASRRSAALMDSSDPISPVRTTFFAFLGIRSPFTRLFVHRGLGAMKT